MNSGLSLVGNLINCETSNEEPGLTLSCHRKIASKIFEFVEIIHENITTDEILPSLSLVVTVIFILIGGISHH